VRTSRTSIAVTINISVSERHVKRIISERSRVIIRSHVTVGDIENGEVIEARIAITITINMNIVMEMGSKHRLILDRVECGHVLYGGGGSGGVDGLI